MTEKRFYTDGQYVMQNDEVYVICGGEHNADVVATALNKLFDENNQLKKENHRLKSINKRLIDELAICYEKLGCVMING